MLALEVEVNGRRHLAGSEDWSILTFTLAAIRKTATDEAIEFLPHLSLMEQEGPAGETHHARWALPPIKPGDVVTARFVEVESADPPTKRYRHDREQEECPFTDEEMRELRYRDYLDLKAEFEGQDPPTSRP